MNESTSDTSTAASSLGNDRPNHPDSVSASRRRLIRAGATAVPVVATLASRPAHAWSCKSPSAWGSLKANPNTSLRNNAGHQSYTDETWTLANWKANSARSDTGLTDKPWDKLKDKYPGIVTSATKTGGNFDYTKVTVAMLQSVVGIAVPTGVDTAAKCSGLMASSTFGSYCLAAQLNFILLSPLSQNQMENCLSLNDLKKMATGQYPPAPSAPWSQSDVSAYLTQNYIVRRW